MHTKETKATSSVARQIAELGPWFHNLHLPSGEQTAPEHGLGDFPRRVWQGIAPHVPEDLRGWTALDIGCNAGFYAFELARRGAEVTAIDHDGHYLRQARWAAEQALWLLRGLDDEQARRVGSRARRRILARHTAGHRAEEIERYFREVASGRVRKSSRQVPSALSA